MVVRFHPDAPVFIAGIQGIGQSHKLGLVGSNPTSATKLMVSSYSGYYTGLSSRISGFDSPRDRQVFIAALAEWLGTVLIRRLERERRFNSYRQHQFYTSLM